MAKKVKQQINEIREEAKSEAQEELKVEGITPERKKQIIKDWNKINIKLKEVELRNKKKESFSHKFSGLGEFKQLNGKTVYSDALREREQRDRDSMSLEMIYSQMEPMYRVVLEDVAKYVRPGIGKELINRCKIDRGFIRDLTGIINVLKFIEIKDYSRAKTAFLYFQLGEKRINDIEKYFNVNLGSLFKDDIKQVYATAKELGMSEKELAQNAARKMTSYSSQAEDMERSVTGADYATEMVTGTSSYNNNLKMQSTGWSSETKEQKQTRLNKTFIDLMSDKTTSKTISNTFSMTLNGINSEDFVTTHADFLAGPKNEPTRKRIEATYTVTTFVDNFVMAINDHNIKDRVNETALAAEMLCLSDSAQMAVAEILFEKVEIETTIETLKGTPGNETKIEELQGRIAEIDEEFAGVTSGKQKPRNRYNPSDAEKENSKLIMELKKELKALKVELNATEDPVKRAEIQAQIAQKRQALDKAKAKKISLVTVQPATVRNVGRNVASQIARNLVDRDRGFISQGEMGLEAGQFVRVLQKTRLSREESKKIIEDVGLGNIDPEKTDRLEFLTTSFTSEYISQVQNEKSLDYLLSQIDNPDKHKRENSIGAILNYINERVNMRRNMLTNESIAELEDALNQVKAVAGNVKMGTLSVQALEKALKEARQNLSNKEKALQESDSKFATLPTDKAAEDYAKFIQKFYTTVIALPKAYEVNYTLEEVDKLQAQFDMCESMIAEKGVVGDDGFNNQRKQAKAKIENIRYRVKMNPILDTTGVIKLKTREERVALMRENLKYLVGLIKNSDGCQLRAEDNAQIKELLIEYRKLRVLNWDLENGERLEDIDEMIRVIDDWSMETDLSKSKTQERVDTLRTTLNEVMELVAAGDFGPATVKKWADAKKFYNNLKNQQKVNRRILIEFDENYAKIEQAFKEKAGPSVQVQLVSIRDGLKESLMTKKFYKIDIFKLRYEKIKTLDIPGLDGGVVSEIDELLKTAQKERTARSDRGASLLEQIIDVGQEIKTMRNITIDKGFESFDEAKFNGCVLDFEYLKELIQKDLKDSDKTIIKNIETTIEGFKQEISNHKAGKSREKLTESDYEAIFVGAEPEQGDKKGKFTVAGPVESEGASREIEESPIPEPEGMGASKELEGKGISAQEIENMQKK